MFKRGKKKNMVQKHRIRGETETKNKPNRVSHQHSGNQQCTVRRQSPRSWFPADPTLQCDARVPAHSAKQFTQSVCDKLKTLA